jgi:valyl-tRNA synthetase
MHRTLGNVIDPWPLIKKHGADAMRIFVASETNPGDDFRISEAKIGGAAKFVTKLWNVARFISSFEEPEAGKLLAADEWILAELNRLIEASRGAYEDLNLFLPSNRGREFLWNIFAPHYVEMVKARAYEGDTGARWTLHTCLRDLLRLLAPIAPFSTDKIWRSMYGGSVHAETFPTARDGIPGSRADFTEKIVAFNGDIWKQKRDQGLPLNVELPGVSIPPELKPFEGDLRRMHRLGS